MSFQKRIMNILAVVDQVNSTFTFTSVVLI